MNVDEAIVRVKERARYRNEHAILPYWSDTACEVLVDEIERLRAAITEIDAKFGHFSALETTGDTTPLMLLGDLAKMVRAAAEAAGGDC